jgi:hypothetical protein
MQPVAAGALRPLAALLCVAGLARAEPPRLLRPIAGARVTSQQPRLRWTPSGAVTVELCRDRACAQAIASIETAEAEAVPKTALPPGAVYWRVRARSGESSAVWPMWVGRRSAAIDAVKGLWLEANTVGDLDGDGRADHLPKLTPPEKTRTFGASFAGVGDVNGDGYSDLLVGAAGVNAAYLYFGSAGGVAPQPSLVLRRTSKHEHASFGVTVGAAGDLDGDGFADYFVTASGNNMLYVYRGGAAPSAEPWLSLFGGGDTQWASAMCGAGDLDGDGRADLAYTYLPDPGGEPVYELRWIPGRAGKLEQARSSIPLPLDPDAGFLRLSAAGDLDGDGYDDLTVAPERGGKAAVVHGGAHGPTARVRP